MIVSTHTGTVRGALIEFKSLAIDHERAGLDGIVLIKREGAPMPSRPYSTHRFYTDPDGIQHAESGHYDMTLEDARADFAERGH